MDLVIARPEGLYCPPGDFYIDPWRPVERAVITHGHGDHFDLPTLQAIAAGLPLSTVRPWLNHHARLARAMPNTPARDIYRSPVYR